MSKIALIIPCFNEAGRLDTAVILDWTSKRSNYDLYFVNDGSTDGTRDLLLKLSSHLPNQIYYLDSKQNVGKAASIRKGILYALQFPYSYAGYFDADLSTPLEEIERLIQLIQKQTYSTVFGSRIRKGGATIIRSSFRHIIGRCIATIIDLRFKLNIYDTQCGAKVFKVCTLKEVVQEDFKTKWFFDVELFLRLRKINKLQILEEPLRTWQDKSASKLNFLSFPLILKELAVLLCKY